MMRSRSSSSGGPTSFVTTETRFTVEPFDPSRHDRSGFSCGVPAMERWFSESISDQIKRNRLRVWCAVAGDGTLVGFYGLAAHSVAPTSAGTLASRRERHPVPAIYLVALATDANWQGQGLGGALMADALARALSVSADIGAAAIVLDVLEDAHHAERMTFYERLGFAPIDPDQHPNRLFLSMKAIEAALAAS